MNIRLPTLAALSNVVPGTTSATPNTIQKSEGASFPDVNRPGPVSRFLRLLWCQWRLLVPALIAALFASFFSVVQPLFWGRIVGLLSNTRGLSYAVAKRELLKRISRIAGIYCIEVICTITFVSLISRAVDNATRSLRELLFRKTFTNDIGFFDETGRLEVERTVSSEIKEVRNGIANNLSRDRGIRAFLEVGIGLVLCFRVAGSLAIPVFGFLVPIVSTIVAQMGLRNGRVATRLAQKESEVQFYVNERLRGLRTLKAFGAENKEMRSLSSLLDCTEKSSRQLGTSKAMTEAANRISIYATILVFFTTGGLMICAGTLTYELFASITGFVWILNFTMQGLSFTLSDAAKVTGSLKSIYEVLDEAEAYEKIGNARLPSESDSHLSFQGDVRFENVHFHYPSRPDTPVLKGIDFSIRPGQMIALVGDSGGGKSTIAAMLSRFYASTAGQVTVDGVDIQSIPSDVYAKLISVVDQEPILFRGSIRDNIAYGLPDDLVSEKSIIRAAKEANAHEFICQLANGYETEWNPGSNLSGGQRQRIAIARSLVKSPQILILDEATSALDQESERMVQSALERIMKNRTVLIIAHRLSTVRSADKILFVKDGQVVEEGTYDDLLSKSSGHFHALVQSAASVAAKSTEKL